MLRLLAFAVLGLALAGCASRPQIAAMAEPDDADMAQADRPVVRALRAARRQEAVLRRAPEVTPGTLGPDPAVRGFLWCVPYARAVSDIEISGDAWQWWGRAAGRYDRGALPQVGAVLAFRPSGAMRLGHIGVVAEIVDARTILLSHSNWGSRGDVWRGRIQRRMPVVDVSPDNDWTAVKVMNNPGGSWSRVYPTHGFIYQTRIGVVAQAD